MLKKEYMMDDVNDKWEKFLNPDEIKPYLLFCSLFLTSYEILKGIIIDRPIVFFSDWSDLPDPIKVSDYEENVLSLDEKQRPLQASINWHQQNNIIDADDIQIFNRITKYRNTIAHRLLKHCVDNPIDDIGHIFNDIVNLIYKIEKWWIINYELEINPIENVEEIDYDKILPGAIITIQILVDIALGEKEESEHYYKKYIETFKKNKK
ncbi:MAG: hypothetical protein M0P93_01875 [Candidatus Cloacimonetes bacterium]|jgi:hypothetical protein|nr:hypothetical protein [Candidatus Cloacimonadota bacterium]